MKKEKQLLTNLMQKILKEASPDFICAMQAGVPMKYEFDGKTSTVKISTLNDIFVDREQDEITVHERIK